MSSNSELIEGLKGFLGKAFGIEDEIEVMVVLACTKNKGDAAIIGDASHVVKELNSLTARIIREATIKEIKDKEKQDVAVQE